MAFQVASMDWYVSVICTRHGMSNSPASPCPSCGKDSGSDSKVAGDQAETTVSGKINQLSTVVRLPVNLILN